MDKICRSATAFYRLPRIGQLNMRLNHFANPASIVSSNYSQNLALSWNHVTIRHYNAKPPGQMPGSKSFGNKPQEHDDDQEQNLSIVDILEREIQDETAEMSRHLSSDQFPGFSVETDDAEVKLTKQIGESTVTVRFTVSSSLNEWPNEQQSANEQEQEFNTSLLSMPEFQVQISRNNQTLEVSCFFDQLDHEEESGEQMGGDPIFSIDELVMYSGEPKESEFAVSAEFFQEDLQMALMQYLAEHGIDDEFGKNLVNFSTSYEKKQYISLMKRLKSFVAK